MKRPYHFMAGPWENSTLPTIVRDDPEGGDPHILATLKRVHNQDALYELCRLANDAFEDVNSHASLTTSSSAKDAKIERLREALRPFAERAEEYVDDFDEKTNIAVRATFGLLKSARSALRDTEADHG